MNAEELLAERIRFEIDMEVLKEIGEEAGVDLSKEIELSEKKFDTKLYRVIHDITNKSAHDTDSL
jgi:hypothetical protein